MILPCYLLRKKIFYAENRKLGLHFASLNVKIHICYGNPCRILPPEPSESTLSHQGEVFGLPNIKSAKKRVLVNAAKAKKNA